MKYDRLPYGNLSFTSRHSIHGYIFYVKIRTHVHGIVDISKQYRSNHFFYFGTFMTCSQKTENVCVTIGGLFSASWLSTASSINAFSL